MKLRQIRYRVFRIAVPLYIMRELDWQKGELLDISIESDGLKIIKSKKFQNKLLKIGSSYMVTIPINIIDKLRWVSGLELEVKKGLKGIVVKKSVPLEK